MIPIKQATPDGAPVERVRGFVSHPETTRSTRDYVSTFVNDRYVAASTLRRAVVDAYGGQLAADRYPFAVVFVDLPSDAVDVNVHPRKLEVRFGAEEAVRRVVREAVEDALLDHGLLRSSAPRGRSAPEEVELPDEAGPGSPGSDDSASDPDAAGDSSRGGSTGVPSGVDATGDQSTTDTPAGSISDASSDSSISDASSDSSGSEALRGSTTADVTGDDGTEVPARDDAAGDAEASGDTGAVTESGGVAGSTDGESARIRDAGSQSMLGVGTTDREREFDRLPNMRVLGQIDETYVVAETGDGLLLIDQHAADERVHYERLRDDLDSPATQALAEPVEIELTAREAELFPAFADALADLGFRAEGSGDRTVDVEAVPAVFSEAFDPELLRDVLGEFLDGAAETSVDARVDDLLADLACHPSITGSTSLTEGSVRALLVALADCENPYACPHGRPVILEIDYGEIEDRFERDYPGHGGHHP
jgi:DNA mismatch repair protein MutL